MRDDLFPGIRGYRPIRKLGAGGMGVVFLAEDVALARRVAVKVLSGAASPARFLREARAMATVEHPNVVRIYSSGQYDGGMYLVLEYIEGESLAERLRRTGALPIDEVFRLAGEIADGLEAASSRGIVHRDVKPSNILIDARGRAHVADFGLAKSYDRVAETTTVEAVTHPGAIFGTPRYISPEQARGDPADARSDIYSLGVVMYEMLAGVPPFGESGPGALLARHLHTVLPPVAERRRDTPPRLAALVDRMTQKDPAVRPQTIAEVCAALVDAASPVTRWTRGSPFRGLSAFDFDDAPIFCGRGRAIAEVLNAIRVQADEGCAFTLVFGMSGSGKSSLVRAGVVPRIVADVAAGTIWRRAVVRPSDVAAGDVFDGLAAALLRADALPELGADGTTAAALATLLRGDPRGAVPLVKGGLSQVAADVRRARDLPEQPDARLVLVVDQMEELFTIERIDAAERAAFVDALAALARGGRVWILATLRSDFYGRCEELPVLMDIKTGAGTYHLGPPTPAEIGQMICQPAAAAGLRFDVDAATGLPLHELLRDAAGPIGLLPLLQFALEQLYERRTPDGALTHEAYRAIGGLSGALSRRAEEVFAALPLGVQGHAADAFAALVRVDTVTDAGFARKYASLEALAASPRAFVDAFIAARLFVADQADDGRAVVSIAHEALLVSWPRLQAWLDENRERLRIRARVAAAAAHWIESGRRTDLLLPDGKSMEDAELVASSADLSAAEREFIAASRSLSRRRRRELRVSSTVGVALFVTSLAAHMWFLWSVVPRLAAVLAKAGAALPLPVRLLILVSELVARLWPLLPVVLIGGYMIRKRLPAFLRWSMALAVMGVTLLLLDAAAWLAIIVNILAIVRRAGR